MEYLVVIIFVLIIGGLVARIFLGTFRTLRLIFSYFFRQHVHHHFLISRRLPEHHRLLLDKCFGFYRRLSEADKVLFEKRVRRFIKLKEFIPRGGIKEVTEPMKVLVAGAAVQLTFGYPGVYFAHFWRILIYPDNYYSNITQRYHQGEVSERGIIVLSWRNFMEGLQDPTDGRNLALHEMAHALQLEDMITNEEYNFFDKQATTAFEKLAAEEIARMRQGEESFFRAYAATNMHEFFAVSVELFFEKPEELRLANGRLYASLVRLLKVDPAAPGNRPHRLDRVA